MTVGEARLRFPALWLLVMAFNMSASMVAWMRHRGHRWSSSLEMATAMILLAIPLVVPLWLQLITVALPVGCTAP
jgi:hypothetical protein